jgi:hypothetical protein
LSGENDRPIQTGELPGGVIAEISVEMEAELPEVEKILLFRFLKSTAAQAGGTLEDAYESWNRCLPSQRLMPFAGI